MAIRKYSYPRDVDLSSGLQNVLRKNGLQAHISFGGDGDPKLIVIGHDSPALSYNLTDEQVKNLMGWGSTYENKKAYNTLTSIIRKDFNMPDNFVSASNAFGRVAMGLHGYRLGHGEYGYNARGARWPWFAPFSRHGRGWAGDFVGYAPRDGWFHLRRNGPILPERPDGRIKPGEMRSGGYGFYYKGQQKETKVDVLDRISIEPEIKPLETAPRPKGQGIPLSQHINLKSEVTNAFTADKFLEVLKSHGIAVDKDKKTLIIQSNLSKVDMQYDLTPEELKMLTANTVKGKNGVTLDKRLQVINGVIGRDFATPVTLEMLETKELVDLELKPEVKAEVEAPFIEQEKRMQQQQQLAEARAEQQKIDDRIENDPKAINGRKIQEILGNKGWFQPVANGREMVIGEIRVDKTEVGTFVMAAEINGRWTAHTISAKDYDKFIELDDKHRLRMFNDVFKEVEIKSAHGKSLYEDDVYMAHDGRTVVNQQEVDLAHADSNVVDGKTLQAFNEKKGFYREREGGREVEVGRIAVEPEHGGKYKMTAVINGQSITHEITQKQYDKFLAVDDYHRMQLFAKIFNEVDIKTRPEARTNIGAAVLAALMTAGDVLAYGMGRPPMPRPEVYAEAMPATIYHKQGVVSPGDIAAANFRSLEANMGSPADEHMGRGL